MKRRWNALIYAGFGLTLAAFVSYYTFFLRFPITRDVPWVNLILFAAGLVMLAAGTHRAYRQPIAYRGKVSGPVLGALSVVILALFVFLNFWFARRLPPATFAPAVGAKAPEFTLPDTQNRPVSLAQLRSGKKWVLLVFYRGYW